MKKSAHCVHALFECQDCGVQFEIYKNAQALAAKHAMKYGHLVTGEVGIALRYDGGE